MLTKQQPPCVPSHKPPWPTSVCHHPFPLTQSKSHAEEIARYCAWLCLDDFSALPASPPSLKKGLGREII
jgi:hypothetical protein